MNRLLIFAKYPEPGQVKTRLALTVGSEKAAAFYKEMVEKIVDQIVPQKGEYIPLLYFDPPEKKEAFKTWLPLIELQIPQCSGDLGKRLSLSIQHSFDEGANKVIVIGSDCIEVNQFLILRALTLLDENDLVIGPASDGGYYLLGCRMFYRQFFEDIAWSTNRVLKQTLEKAKSLKLQVKLLPTLSDIDSYEDYKKFSDAG